MFISVIKQRVPKSSYSLILISEIWTVPHVIVETDKRYDKKKDKSSNQLQDLKFYGHDRPDIKMSDNYLLMTCIA